MCLSKNVTNSMPDCGVRDPMIKTHHMQLRYTVLGKGCTPLLQSLGRLNLHPPLDGKIKVSAFGLSNNNKWRWWM